jgi:hypothetical protein
LAAHKKKRKKLWNQPRQEKEKKSKLNKGEKCLRKRIKDEKKKKVLVLCEKRFQGMKRKKKVV